MKIETFSYQNASMTSHLFTSSMNYKYLGKWHVGFEDMYHHDA